MIKRSIHFLLFILALLFSPTALTLAEEIAPGRITNPDGLQMFQSVAYNSADDEYALLYQGDSTALARRLDTTGAFLAPVVALDGPIGVSNVVIVYNPTANEYLSVYRSDENIYGRYLDNDLTLLGSRFLIGTGGAVGTAGFSVTSDRYFVVWREGPSPIKVRYAFIEGDSTSADPIIEKNILANGDNPQTAWGSVHDKFLVVYTRTVGSLSEETFGKIVEGDGTDRSDEFLINGGNKSQTNPQVAYAPSHDVFLVSTEDWRKKDCCRADVNGQRVSSAGNLVGARFPIVNTGNGGWDVPGPLGFSEITGQFISTSYIEPKGVAREINPGNTLKGPITVLGDQITAPVAIATSSDPDDPQAIVLSRANLGGDGVHAHILPLEIPPPSIVPAVLPSGQVGTFYSGAIPVSGGTQPLFYEFVPGFGNVTPGLGGPNPGTGVFSGTPTTPGVFGFRVRVTDDDGRVTEADLVHAIGLQAPVLQSPVGVATNNRMPTFDWDPVPGATTYDLIVENLTKGNTPIKQFDLNTTAFTPGSNLPANSLYRWKVMAKGGGMASAFSGYASLEIDTNQPPAAILSGKVPEPNTPITSLVASDVSTEASGTKKKENAVDGKNTTSWMSVGTASQQNEHITVDLGASFNVSQISLRSKRGPRFPVDFELQISNSPNSGFVTLASFSAFDAASGVTYDFPVTPTNGRYVKILVTKKGVHKGLLWVEIAEIGVFRAINTAGSILYSFKAPLDMAGTANESVASYNLRYMAGNAASFNFATATPFVGEPTPAPPGKTEFILVQGLAANTLYSAALTSTDDAGNVSVVSNIVEATTEP
jgi:hypothetical protein